MRWAALSDGDGTGLLGIAGEQPMHANLEQWANLDGAAHQYELTERDTVAFDLGNVTDKPRALAEMHRVLRPGGFALVLEFSQLYVRPLQPLYDAYSFQVLPRMGRLVAGDAESYRYLAESIRMHPDQETLRTMMTDAGLEDCDYTNLSAGVVAIHRGYRY
jgi:demethylmenaquinone methyltransferase/2-methoxy-6-polyprenyl-1,4-benzoquinol methylase